MSPVFWSQGSVQFVFGGRALWVLDSVGSKERVTRAWVAVLPISSDGTVVSLVMSTVHADSAVRCCASRALVGS